MAFIIPLSSATSLSSRHLSRKRRQSRTALLSARSSSFHSRTLVVSPHFLPSQQHFLPSCSPPLRVTACAQQNGSKTSPTQSPQISRPDDTVWAREYKSYIQRNGRVLCSMAYAGYNHSGIGAVFADYDRARTQSTYNGESTVEGMIKARGKGEKDIGAEAIPSMYLSREKILNAERANKNDMKPADHQGLMQIMKRVEGYDPERQFVVVFSWGGVMGADVVTPTIPPRQVWEMDKDKEKET